MNEERQIMELFYSSMMSNERSVFYGMLSFKNDVPKQ